jgi:hypothetical protein
MTDRGLRKLGWGLVTVGVLLTLLGSKLLPPRNGSDSQENAIPTESTQPSEAGLDDAVTTTIRVFVLMGLAVLAIVALVGWTLTVMWNNFTHPVGTLYIPEYAVTIPFNEPLALDDVGMSALLVLFASLLGMVVSTAFDFIVPRLGRFAVVAIAVVCIIVDVGVDRILRDSTALPSNTVAEAATMAAITIPILLTLVRFRKQ